MIAVRNSKNDNKNARPARRKVVLVEETSPWRMRGQHSLPDCSRIPLRRFIFCSLPNLKGDSKQVGEQPLHTRDVEAVERHITRWDRDGRAYYFCVSTVEQGQRRNKAACAETPALHADLDYKSIADDEDSAIAKLQALRCPPTVVVKSGHGLHAYWMLKEALATSENQDRIEVALKQLADVVGGDLEVTHVAALMRLPGTTNSKGNGARQICEVAYQTDRFYELDDIEEFLAEQSPVIVRRARPPKPANDNEENTYTRFARLTGFKAPIDVDVRLRAMLYQGNGDAAIHSTQLAVTSSLLSRGDEVEQVVAVVMEATRAAAGEYGVRWNWRAEERNIRRMCATWVKKISSTGERVAVQQKASGNGAAPVLVHSINEARVKKAGASRHVMMAQMVADKLKERDEQLICTEQGNWRYRDHAWMLLTDSMQRGWLNDEIQKACNRINLDATIKLVNETRAQIERNATLEVPEWDAHGLVPTKSGLIYPDTLELVAAMPEHFCTWHIPFDYEPDARCPLFDQMLQDMFADRDDDERAALIDMIWQWLGSALLDVKPRGMQKGLVIVGGTKSGKSALISILSGLFGVQPITTTLADLDKAHGTFAFQRRAPWILHETFAVGVWHLSTTVKTIITGDPFNINVKNGPMLTRRFTGPIIWGSNVMPQFKEDTRAMVDRLLVIECEQVFSEREPIGVAKLARERGFDGPATMVLRTEMSGVLNSALAGLRRALKAGAITVSREASDVAATIHRDNNPVAEFLNECCEYNTDLMVSRPDFCLAVNAQYVERQGEDRRLLANDRITKWLKALHDQRIATDRVDCRDMSNRYFCGIALNTQGKRYWSAGAKGRDV